MYCAVFTGCTTVVTRCHSLLFVVARCHSLHYSLSLFVTRCTTRCHTLSFVVTLCTTRCHSLYHSLSLVVIRCHSLPLDVRLVCLFINHPLKTVQKIQNVSRAMKNITYQLVTKNSMNKKIILLILHIIGQTFLQRCLFVTSNIHFYKQQLQILVL